MDPALVELFEEGTADDVVSVILRLAPGAAPPGVRIVARFGPIATCRLRRGDIPSVRMSLQVLSMKAARLYGPALDLEAAEADDDLTPRDTDRRRPQGPLPTGAGVVVAHIDWGLDFACPAFRNADGTTRIVSLWDQAAPYDPAHPNPYGYGRIHRREDIDAALRTADPYAALGYAPWTSDSGSGSHGTHTTSLSCGNGRDGGPSGVAPEAEIVFVDLSTQTADGPTPLGDSVAFLEGLDFVARCAGELPLVINASLGRQAGQKDGLTLTEQGIDAFLLVAPGRAVVQSAGNYFEKEAHASRQLAPGSACTLHFDLPEGRGEGELDLWYRGADRFGVTLHGPDGVAVVTAEPDTRATVTFRGRPVGRLYHRIDDPNNHDNQVFLTLDADAPAGAWELRLAGDHVADGRFHAWIERVTPGARRRMRFAADEVRREMTLGTICTGLWSIAAAAYDAHSADRGLGRFSSSGPTRDHRRLKPTLTAPGVRILGSRSRPRGGRAAPALTRMSGTSMAAPHVTGSVALMFAAAPRRLTVHETRALLITTADAPPEAATPAERLRMGAGFLDIEAVVAAAAAVPRAMPHVREAQGETITAEAIMERDIETATETATWDDGETEGGWTFPPTLERSDLETAAEARALENLEAAEAARPDRDRGRGWGPPPGPLPFQFQIPLGGGPAGIAVPIGGMASPFALTVPLGGAAPAPVAVTVNSPPPPAPAATAAAPAAGDPPLVVATPDPVLLAGSGDTEEEGEAQTVGGWGERVVSAHAALAVRARPPAHSAALFEGLAAELADGDDPPAFKPDRPGLSATALFRLFGDGRERLSARIAGALPNGRLVVLAEPNASAAGLEPRSGDLLVRAARGQGFGCVSVVAAPRLVRGEDLGAVGWRGEGDPAPPPGRYIQVLELGPWAGLDGRPFARRLVNGAGLVPPDTLLLRLLEAGEADAETVAPARPMLRSGSRGPLVVEAQTKLNTVSTRRIAAGEAGIANCPLQVDGRFGPRTDGAVRSFQRRAFPSTPGEWDGVIGPHTWAALDAMSGDPIPVPNGPPPSPPAPPPLPSPPAPPPLQGAIAAGREVVQRLPLLAGHRGTPPDLILKWNDMAAAPQAIDVVVHLHGHSGRKAAMRIDVDKEPRSGLDFADPQPPHDAGRTTPTLLVLPRGDFNGGGSAGAGYGFPALAAAGGLERLIDDALARFAARIGATSVARGRLILTAHSGGGAWLIRLLASGRDPDEVHVFDAFYQDPSPVADWARRRLASGAADPALRVVYLDNGSTSRLSAPFAGVVSGLLPPGDPRARRFRVEATTAAHDVIPPRFGWRLLRDAGEDLPLRGGSTPPPSPPGPVPPPVPTPPVPTPTTGALDQAAVDRLAAVTFANAAELNAAFASVGSFQDWFNATLSGKGPFRRSSGGGALHMPTAADARSRFDGFWDGTALAYDVARVSLLEFASLVCIVMNETDGDFASRTESSGRGGGGRTDASGPHRGLAYFFDAIQLAPNRHKRSYNTMGRTAGRLFDDPVFIAAHGAKGGAARLARHGSEFGGVWNGTIYPATDFATDEHDPQTEFIREADFYKFRGRGVIQTTGRGAYVPFVRFVQGYAGANPTLLALKAAWLALSPDDAASTSSGDDWERIFATPDTLAKAVALHAGHGAHDYRMMSRDVSVLLAIAAGKALGPQGSISLMGQRISGSADYARHEYRDRVIALMEALSRAATAPGPGPTPPSPAPPGPTPTPPAPTPPTPHGHGAVPAPDEAAAQAQWDAHPRAHGWFGGQFARYRDMAPLYARRGVGDAAGYLDANITGLTFFGLRQEGHRDFVPALAAAAAAFPGGAPTPAVTSFGCLNVRPIRGTTASLSNHALGRAIDLNPEANPRITSAQDILVIDAVTGASLLAASAPAELRRLSRAFVDGFGDAWVAQQTRPDLVAACRDRGVRARLDGYAANGFCTLDQRLIETLIAQGLRWGGAYRSSKDFMHFEFVDAF